MINYYILFARKKRAHAVVYTNRVFSECFKTSPCGCTSTLVIFSAIR